MEPADSTMEEKEIRSTFSMRKVLVPVLIGLIAAGYLLWRDLGKERYERALDGTGNMVWVDSNANGLPDLSDPDEFREVAEGAGEYRKMSTMEVLGTINWTDRARSGCYWQSWPRPSATSVTSTGCACYPMVIWIGDNHTM
jgi:hypothetical protein